MALRHSVDNFSGAVFFKPLRLMARTSAEFVDAAGKAFLQELQVIGSW
jgi:hypothetical protein